MRFRGELFEWDEGGWHFVSLPLADSEDLRSRTAHLRKGFGSLRVRATIGASTWETSVFPSASGAYLLPVKKPVRRAEGLEAGDVVEVTVELRER